jgi:hypothetical protein
MVILSCDVPDCEFRTIDDSDIVAVALLNNHNLSHQLAAGNAAAAARSKGPKLDRPRIDMGVDGETWNAFERRWDNFRRGSNIDANSAAVQLFQCAADTLGDALLKADPTIASRPPDEVMAAMKSLAIVPVSRGVKRAELVSMHQSPDEAFRAFAARVRGKAETCGFSLTNTCACGINNAIDYTNETIRDVLLAGIADLDIRREALGVEDSQLPTVNDVVGFVEGREMARNALPSPSSSAMSTFKRDQRGVGAATIKGDSRRQAPQTALPPMPVPKDTMKQAPCPDCNKNYFLFSEGPRGWNRTAHERCKDCYLARRRRRGGGGREIARPAATNAVEVDEPFSQISAIATHRRRRRRHAPATPDPRVVALQHHIFTSGQWRRAKFTKHPTVRLRIRFDETAPAPGPRHPQTSPIFADVNAVTDSGAMSVVWSLEQYLANGFHRNSLHPVSMNMRAANKSKITIDGAFFGVLEGRDPHGEVVSCREMIYVSSDIQDLFLSHESLIALGILPPDFPTIGSAAQDAAHADCRPSHAAIRVANDGCGAHDAEPGNCGCPKRQPPPKNPSSLPFACVPANIDKMRGWVLDRYASSTFNTCPHQTLPVMLGPPVEIHLEESATPRACHTAATVPVHWQEKVKEDLLRDEALGVIERVPYGEASTWCHRMVVTRKHDGTPRRTVDLSPLNRFCKREPFASESPFHLARRIPGNTWKTVSDAWNGYHSAPLRQADRHLTTFITPFGRWRYCRAPQGFLSSGDAYNRRFDAILTDFERKQRCVDDTVHYDGDLETHWWRTLEFLKTVGDAGIVLNPDKLQFCRREVDFAGFRVTESTIEPLPKFLDAIRDFPTPKSTTDIRSWFGLVNQVSSYAQLREMMEPFRPFLSPKYKFFWSGVLDDAFRASKVAIIQAIREGVRIFDMNKRTCLRPDWSTSGIGYFLLQKHCECPSQLPDCCQGGWRIILAGSRFLSSAESRYAPIEGEALAVAWSLEQTRFFTQGCADLLVITDHKPLVKIFGDRTLDEIANTRLFRLKQRALPWHFSIGHMPGRTNKAADATSRHPSPAIEVDSLSIDDQLEHVLAAAIHGEASGVTSLPWSRIVEETYNDEHMRALTQTIENGFPDRDRNLPHATSFWQFRDGLYISDGAILFEDRVVIPPALRRIVMDNLHAAHQGVTAMENRARAIVFWPGITADIHAIRAACSDCNRNAPSLPSLPAASTSPPSTPFESLYADYFDLAGSHYLVVGDRLSGWSEVFACPPGSSRAGAAGLIGCLRLLFATFGVPEEFSSDGGPEFSSGALREFLRRWGVQHRISSAYNPQSNGRAEVAVKATKRLLRSNVGPTGNLDNDRFLRALLQQRNTPDPDCDISPAQIIFGRPLRDSMSFVNRLDKYSNPHIRPTWREAWAMKESSLRTRYARSQETLNTHARPAPALHVGDRCFVQNGAGNHPRRWDRTGTVTEALNHDKYSIKIDGSGRVTTRNRKFIRPFVPVSTDITMPAPPTLPTPSPRRQEPSDPTAIPPMPAAADPAPPPLTLPPSEPSAPTRAQCDNPVPPPSPSFVTPPSLPTDPDTATPTSPPAAARPHRAARKPAWQDSGDWVMKN